MTEVDESLLTLAKLDEVLHGDLDTSHPMHDHAGLVEDGKNRSVLSFCESIFQDGEQFRDSDLGNVISSTIATDAATRAVHEELPGLAAHLVGITETEYDASSLTLAVDLVDLLYNHGAPAFVTLMGNPNSGKTNTLIKLVELYQRATRILDDLPDDLTVISNLRSWSAADIAVTSMHDLMVELTANPDRPTAVVIDEASTHFDARTNRRPVAEQWTPATKRYAKVSVELVGLVCHTGKDLHPECKRLTTLAVEKLQKEDAVLYERWPADHDAPTDPLFTDPLTSFEASSGYDPDDAAPWSWDLRADLFSRDLGWRELADELKSVGPAEP